MWRCPACGDGIESFRFDAVWILFRNVVLARNLNSSFDTHEAAQYAVDYLSGLKLDGQTIRVEMDWGYSDGRQYGRASNGGQMRHYINDIKNSAKSYHKYPNNDRHYNSYDRRNSYRKRDSGDSYGDSKRRRYYPCLLIFSYAMYSPVLTKTIYSILHSLSLCERGDWDNF